MQHDELLAVALRLVTALEVQNHRLGELIDLVLMGHDQRDDEEDQVPSVGLDGQPIVRR